MMKILILLFISFNIGENSVYASKPRKLSPSRAARNIHKDLRPRARIIHRTLNENSQENKVLLLRGNRDIDYYLGKIRMEFIPTLSWRIPGNLMRLGVSVFPVLHLTRNPPAGYKKVK